MVTRVVLYFLLITALCGGTDLRLSTCKQHGELTRWQEDGRGNYSAASDAPAAGKLDTTCRVKFERPVPAVRIELDEVHISFVPKGSSSGLGGLVISFGECRLEFLRVAGEDWIEARRRSCVTRFPTPTRLVEVALEVIDNSTADPIRVDLRGLRVIAEPWSEQSPGRSAH